MGRLCTLVLWLTSCAVLGQSTDWTQSISMSNRLAIDSSEVYLGPMDEHGEWVFREVARVLGMDQEQRSALKDLHTAYTAQRAEMKRKMDEFQGAVLRARMFDESKDEAERMQREAWKRQSEAGQALRLRLVEDTRALLTESQEAKWPLAEEVFRRVRAMGGVSGPLVRVNIASLASEAAGPSGSTPELVSLLAEYDRSLHALAMKAEAAAAERASRIEGLNGEEWNRAFHEWSAAIMDVAQAITECNRSFARRARIMLRGGALERFEREYRLRALYDGYRSTTPAIDIDGVLDALDGIDVTAEQRTWIRAERDRFAADLGRLTESELDEHIREGFEKTRAQPRSGYRPVGNFDLPRSELRLFVEFVGRVRELLTDAQLEQMPEVMRRRPLIPPTFSE
jgi:Spy/CpxP family protein refolding chaperone